MTRVYGACYPDGDIRRVPPIKITRICRSLSCQVFQVVRSCMYLELFHFFLRFQRHITPVIRRISLFFNLFFFSFHTLLIKLKYSLLRLLPFIFFIFYKTQFLKNIILVLSSQRYVRSLSSSVSVTVQNGVIITLR